MLHRPEFGELLELNAQMEANLKRQKELLSKLTTPLATPCSAKDNVAVPPPMTIFKAPMNFPKQSVFSPTFAPSLMVEPANQKSNLLERRAENEIMSAGSGSLKSCDESFEEE